MIALGMPQQGLWSAYLLNEDRAMFNTAECIAFAGKVRPEVLLEALRAAVDDCEALCGHFVRSGDAAFFQPAALPLEVQRLAIPAEADAEAWVRAWALSDIRRPLELESGRPCRFALLQGEAGDYLYSCVHHIALDGYGSNLLFQRIAEHYDARLRGVAVPASRFGQLAEVHAEEAARSAGGQLEQARHYWCEQLAGLPEPASFSDRVAPIAAAFLRHTQRLPAPLWEGLQAYAAEQGIGWADLLLAVLAAQLGQASGSPVQVLGLMVMNRIGSASCNVPSMQMNIAPLVLALPETADLAACARQVARQRRRDRRHQHYRYEALRRDLGRVGGEQRLFGPLVNIMPFDRPLQYGDLAARTLNLSAGPVEDLTLEVLVGADGVPEFAYDANPACYCQAQLGELQDELFGLLAYWLSEPQLAHGEALQRFFAARRAGHLLCAPADERAALDAALPVLDAVRGQAQAAPGRIALEQGDVHLTYAELLARSEQVAAALQAAGVQPGERVGVMLSRTPAAIVATLAVMLAGAVYVPLDPAQPDERQRLICSAAALARVVTEAAYQHRLATVFDGPIDLFGPLAEGGRRPLAPAASDLAYLMFTSGSTGTPKAVAVGHPALASFVQGARLRYGIQAGLRVLQFAPFNFDASIEEIFVSLAAGATLVLRDDALLESVGAFVEGLETLAIDVADLPTAFWNEWVVALRSGQVGVPAALSTLIIGGEAVHPEQLVAWQQAAGGRVRLINTYGPTEATVVATSCDLQGYPADGSALPIGYPLAAVAALVLERGNRPAGEGELVLCGAQLAEGYLNSDSPAFGELRIGDRPQRVYRTGDRVRRVGERLVYLGRLDNEFKISGYRIQPGEVEAALLALDGVDEACVIGLELEGGLRRLVAFVGGPCDDLRGLRRALAGRLPAAMVPSDWRHYRLLPRTASNKLDRRRLRADYLDGARGETLDDATQRRVAAIWQQILGVGGLGVQDNFFELGGQSLQTIQIVNRLAAEFGMAVKVSDVFDHPVLGDFCRFLDGRRRQPEEQVELVW
ncbi:peptide synthetase [Stutzerimonas stutzeri]|nr:peptide synthetase [Stutzerimonas stutzeri]